MKKILFIAPHADDETIGCGGIIHKFKSQNFKIYWLLVTKIKSKKKLETVKRDKMINKIKKNINLMIFFNCHILRLI